MTMSPTGVLIITGAAGTLGRASARTMAADYGFVCLFDKDEAGLLELAAELPNAFPLLVDLTDPRAVASAFDQAAALAPLRAVVLAAGAEGPVGPIEDCADADFDSLMKLNVNSVWHGLKNSLRLMKAQKAGSIVAVASISGIMGMPMLSPYAASKHAVIGLVRTAAREAAGYQVRVNAVCPAPVRSLMMERIDRELSQRFPERLGGRIDASLSVPMQRYADPLEVARAISFLCSDAASYCSGTAFMIDGGISCR